MRSGVHVDVVLLFDIIFCFDLFRREAESRVQGACVLWVKGRGPYGSLRVRPSVLLSLSPIVFQLYCSSTSRLAFLLIL